MKQVTPKLLVFGAQKITTKEENPPPSINVFLQVAGSSFGFRCQKGSSKGVKSSLIRKYVQIDMFRRYSKIFHGKRSDWLWFFFNSFAPCIEVICVWMDGVCWSNYYEPFLLKLGIAVNVGFISLKLILSCFSTNIPKNA